MHWRTIQKDSFRNIEKLADFLELDAEKRDQILSRPKFSLYLPRRLAEKIEKNNLDDPLLHQFIPLKEELTILPNEEQDPVEDSSFTLSPKLLKKYEGRALLLTSRACAMHCRYCFRQNFSYEPTPGFTEELKLIEQDISIKEIILSGGDPLTLSDKNLQSLIHGLSLISHLQIIRFHTRLPIGIPERITPEFLRAVESPKQRVMILHVNHPKELDSDVISALKTMQREGITLLNQSVLLSGVNDELNTLKELSFKLVTAGVTPYYLHQLDPVQGTSQFKVSDEKGHALLQSMRESLPGYAVPQFVQEIPHRKCKTALHPE